MVDKFKRSMHDISEFGATIKQYRSLLVLNQNFRIEFVKRQGNIVAQELEGGL